MELKLQKENIKTLNIEGETFQMDCNSVKALQAADEFTKATAEVETIDDALIDLCHRTIDKMLGGGAYARLFKGMNTSVAPFYLCLDLVRVLQDEFMKDEREARMRDTQTAVSQLDQMAKSLETLTKAQNIAQAKYGASNARNFAGRATYKNHRR